MKKFWTGVLVGLAISAVLATFAVPKYGAWRQKSGRLSGDKAYRILRCTVLDAITGDHVEGWKVSVDHGLLGYSGPALGHHFSQKCDDAGTFYIFAAPSKIADANYPERMGIKIERNIVDAPHYRAAFLVLGQMWHDGRWKHPTFNYQYPDTTNSKPRYKVILEEYPQPEGPGYDSQAR